MFNISRAMRAIVTLLAVAVSVVCVPAAFATSKSVVISQVYGAGGNSGATLNQDYVEIFNLGTTPVSLNGWSLQYRSSAGASAIDASKEVAVLPNVTIQPGQFLTFAVSAAGANGAAVKSDYDLATASGSVPLNLQGADGQVILSNSTVGLAAGCNVADPQIVDFVGYGSKATCFEGTGPEAPSLTPTTAAIRKVVCTDTDNNAADFTTGTPAPRNASTTFQPCGGTVSSLSVSASANPTSVSGGGQTLLTARVTPLATSTGVTVTVDLSAVGGSSTQPLYDDGTHNDPTAGDNVFNFYASIVANPGTVTLKFTASDAQAHTSTATANVTIVAAAAYTPIHTIQAGAPNSSFLGQTVTTDGIVTTVTGSGFYLEARDANQDTDPSTSEAIFVVTGTNASVAVGNEVLVSGTVKNGGSFLSYATEITGTVTVNLVSTGNALPTPVTIKASDDSPSGGLQQFLRFQSMRFLIPSFITTAPTGGTLTENTETVVSNGEFYGVVAGVTRPFIEPGISVLETSLPTGATYCTATITTNCVPRFDSNPENFLVESTTLGGAPLDVTSNQTITNLLGIVDFTTINGARLLLDKTAPGTLGTPMTYIPVPVAAANEFTVSSMNIERFYSTTPLSGAVTLTAEAYARRLNKISLLLRNVQRMPDIIGMQEVSTLAILNDIANKISADAVAAGQPDPKYSACLYTGNDSTQINTAFLVKTTRVTVTDCTQFNKTETFTNSTGNSATLNDRPPLVLHAIVNVPGYPAYPVTVISNHLKSLIGIDDTTSTGATVRLKKENQDESLARLIQGYQAKGEHVVSVGDYNSFFVNDGYVDNIGVITGNPPATGTVTVGPTANYVAPNPTLVDLETTIADPLQRYDYSFIGNAQTLDHIIITRDLLPGAHIAFSHEDADFPLIQYNDATTPQSSSDHDGAVAFFPLLTAGQTSSASITPTTQDFGSVPVASSSATKTFTITNTGNTSINITSVVTTGDFSKTTTCGATLAAAATCTATVTFTPTVSGARTGSLIVTSNAVSNTTLTAALTGTAIAPVASVTLTPATAAFGSLGVGAVSPAQTFTLSNTGNVAATITALAVTSPFVSATTCGATLAAAANCTISVTFAPKVAGAQTGVLSITTSAATAPLTSSLTGTGLAQATITPTALTFTGLVGKAGAAQTITITNTSGATLGLALSALTGVYTDTTTCTATLAAAASCTVSVVFTPTAATAATATLTATTTLGTVSTTYTITLTGTGTLPQDFTLTPTALSGTTAAGTAASFNLTLTSISLYTGSVRISCTGAPAGSTCTPSASVLNLGLNAAGTVNPLNLQVVISTTRAASAGITSFRGPFGILAILTVLAGCGFIFNARKHFRIAGLLSALLVLALYTSGCGSSSSANTTATPPGTYNYTITATDGTLTHTATYTLTVQ